MNGNTVPVSVVVPCYCCTATIGRAIDSVLRQTRRPAELLLIDDASRDHTLTALRELAESHNGWIKVISLAENGGPARARNAGWNAASQPYIAFLDADDSWHPEKLALQFEYMSKYPDVGISGHLCSIWSGNSSTYRPVQADIRVVTPIELLYRNCFSTTSSVMLKRELQLRFPQELRYSEDLRLWQQAAFSGLVVTRIERVLGFFHKELYGESGLSAQAWKMERGELSNLALLYRNRSIGILLYVSATVFSLAKYIRRLSAISLRRLMART